MDMDQDLEELKGDVDFDFFDSPGKERSPSPQDKKTSEKIRSKPPPAPKSPKPDSPVDIGEYENKRTSNSRSDGPREGKASLFEVIKQEDEDIYSSDSDHTSSQSDSSSFSDVSSVRSGGRARNRSRSSSKTRSPSTSPDQRNTRSKITRKEHSRSDRDNRKTRSRSESVSSQSASESGSGSESTSDFSDRSPSPTPRNKHEKKYKDISQNPVHKVEERPRVARMRPVSAHPSKKQGGSKHQAWGAGNKNNSFRNSDSSHKNKSRYRNEDSDRSGSDSESDMTDVSPLTSPRNSPHKKRYDLQNGSHKKTVQYCGIPPDLENSSYSIRPGEAETLDLNILMKAVSELEKKKRVKDNTRRVMFAPPKAHDRGNYTFTDDRTKLIERENQRLLREIMKHVAEQRAPHQMKRAEPTPVRRVTASAINRQRQQKTIESENMKFLHRLQKVKPTRGMSRDDQIGHYQRTMLYGVPIADDHLKSGRRSRPGSAGSTLSQRSRSMCSVTSGSTNASAASTMRSAASTMRSGRIPGSAKRIVESRPCWSDRW
ncbi:cilia- and flagella-associated protein 97-like [Haliotis rufescens]|uniref:cilia- and flagella-associated protein 97-like n=1 Tax=Haliotis rufescens TaxID=6454 RepID=UPI00201F9088|nr:cilia- and flagella-associated protein 97-like [Haliotis rufescens]